MCIVTCLSVCIEYIYIADSIKVALALVRHARVNSDKRHDPTDHKMTSQQETTSLSQIATVTAKLKIRDKEQWFG